LLLERSTIDANELFSVLPLWKQHVKMMGCISPIQVVLHLQEPTDEYKAEFLRRVQPHYNV